MRHTVTGPEEPTAEELAQFSRLIGRLRALPVDHPARLRAEREAESFSRDGRRARSSERRRAKAAADRALTASTRLGAADRREDAPLAAPAQPETLGTYISPQRCYVCKQPYQEVDSFYHLLCPDCAGENAARRTASADLAGRHALVTGGRVKIGFQLALMLLRDGASVTVTSRFPHDTLRRFAAVAEGDEKWFERLSIVGIDLRDPRQVIGLCDRIAAAGTTLDILINNAAQTLRRPPEAYAPLAAGEREAEAAVHTAASDVAAFDLAPGFRPMPVLEPSWPAALLSSSAATLSPALPAQGFASQPSAATASALAAVDEAGLLPDPAPRNSWSARIGELDPAEVLEAQLVNAVAPALLCDRLLPLLLASPQKRRYIVNVTAVEGRFAVRNKTGGHPHTNMAKAALNMLTRTSADELAEAGVYMCAVDTGWITDENPAPKKTRIADNGFRTPLDIVDGAARVYDPIVRGEAGAPVWGVLLKDYREAEW
jgi:NAD(P)-dependent dehydrogenase (short-subunit alcohol dehydrogenase family)